MIEVSRVFQALGDPVRLEMLSRLSQQQPATISVVSQGLGISRQGARKHLQVLADAGVVAFEPKGRDVHVRIEGATLDAARAFIAKLELQWDDRLAALKQFVEEN